MAIIKKKAKTVPAAKPAKRRPPISERAEAPLEAQASPVEIQPPIMEASPEPVKAVEAKVAWYAEPMEAISLKTPFGLLRKGQSRMVREGSREFDYFSNRSDIKMWSLKG